MAGAVALVTVAPGDERRAVSDEQGRFSFAALPVGEHKLALRGAAILPVDVTVALHEGKSTELTLFVDVKERYASTVRGQRAVVETVEQTLTTAEIQRIPGTQGDTLKAVQNLPGVARAPFGIGLLPVWGSAPADTRVYVDGVNVPVLYHFGGLRSTVNSEMIDGLTFVPGGYQADHGLGLGGIVDVDTRRPRTDGLHGYAQMDLLDGSLMLEGPITKTLVVRGGRTAKLDRRHLAAVHHQHLPALAGLLRLPGAALLAARLGATWSTCSCLGRTTSSACWPGSRTMRSTPPSTRTPSSTGPSSAGRTASIAGGRSPVTSSVGYDAPFGLGVAFGQTPTSLDERAFAYATRAVGRWPITSTLRLDGGVDFEGDRWQVDRAGSPAAVTDLVGGTGAGGLGANGGFSGAGSGYAIDNLTLYTNNIAPFVTATLAFFGGRFTVTPQFRLQVMTFAGYQGTPASFDRGFVSPEPRLALRYQLTPRVALKGAVGLYAQPPDPTAFSRDFGNPNILPEHGTQYVVGAEGELWPGLTAEIDLFWKNLRDLVVAWRKPRRSAARQRRHRARLRRRGPHSPEPGQAPLRLARLYALAERAEGPSGSELVSVRVRPDEHPHRDAQLLPAARVRGGRRAIAT